MSPSNACLSYLDNGSKTKGLLVKYRIHRKWKQEWEHNSAMEIILLNIMYGVPLSSSSSYEIIIA